MATRMFAKINKIPITIEDPSLVTISARKQYEYDKCARKYSAQQTNLFKLEVKKNRKFNRNQD